MNYVEKWAALLAKKPVDQNEARRHLLLRFPPFQDWLKEYVADLNAAPSKAELVAMAKNGKLENWLNSTAVRMLVKPEDWKISLVLKIGEENNAFAISQVQAIDAPLPVRVSLASTGDIPDPLRREASSVHIAKIDFASQWDDIERSLRKEWREFRTHCNIRMKTGSDKGFIPLVEDIQLIKLYPKIRKSGADRNDKRVYEIYALSGRKGKEDDLLDRARQRLKLIIKFVDPNGVSSSVSAQTGKN